jgi:hypothetical protein
MGWKATAITAAAIGASKGFRVLPTSVPTPATRPTYTRVMKTANVP